MVQIIPRSRTAQLREEIGQNVGGGLAKFMGSYLANKQLNTTLGEPGFEELEPSQKLSKLQQAMMPYGELGAEIMQNRAQVEQQKQMERKQSALSKFSVGKELSEHELKQFSPEEQFKIIELQKKKNIGKNIRESLLKAGYPEDTANLWQQQMEAAPVGGQSDVIKQVNDLIRRSKLGKGIAGEEEKEIEKSSIEVPGMQTTELNMDFPELPEPVGMTPSDVVKQSEGREKVNGPLYADAIDSLNALDEDYQDIQTMQNLNESEKLPTGLQKWNVDWNTGDLRATALATPETQLYVKTIARMLGKAKDFYPGRVTNFDLETFKKRFPTLANSPEGRRLIAKQMELSNRIAYLRDETLKAAIEHYGSGADPVLIRKYANQNYRRLKGELEERLKNLDGLLETEYQRGEKEAPVEKPSLEDIFK